MTTAEIRLLLEEVRRDAHEIIPTRMQGVTRRLCAAITDLLARDNIKTFAEQEARIAELERRCNRIAAKLRSDNYMLTEIIAIAEGRDNG